MLLKGKNIDYSFTAQLTTNGSLHRSFYLTKIKYENKFPTKLDV